MRQRFFITSTGTGIGKTFITAALARQARMLGKSVAAYKPIISGFDPGHPEESDTAILLDSLSEPVSPENIQRISPWRFSMPLAPSMAARTEKVGLDFDALIAHGKQAIEGGEEIVLIEGVGGVMVPIDEQHTVLDWIEALGIQAILVTGSYLGTLSHTLTALAVLRARNIPVFAVIVDESEESPVPFSAIVGELSRWTRLPLVPVARRKKTDRENNMSELRALFS
jgi:dethiobiotin synthetase